MQKGTIDLSETQVMLKDIAHNEDHGRIIEQEQYIRTPIVFILAIKYVLQYLRIKYYHLQSKGVYPLSDQSFQWDVF